MTSNSEHPEGGKEVNICAGPSYSNLTSTEPLDGGKGNGEGYINVNFTNEEIGSSTAGLLVENELTGAEDSSIFGVPSSVQKGGLEGIE